MMATASTSRKKNGSEARATVLESLPLMVCSTNRLKPTGGDTSAISTTSTTKMPNQTRSKPAALTIGMTTAVVLPMIQKAGFDLIWFGIFIVLLVEIAEVTPPVGFNLFVLQNMTGKDSNTIARAAIPFFVCLVICIALITVFPQIVTSVPDAVMGASK